MKSIDAENFMPWYVLDMKNKNGLMEERRYKVQRAEPQKAHIGEFAIVA